MKSLFLPATDAPARFENAPSTCVFPFCVLIRSDALWWASKSSVFCLFVVNGVVSVFRILTSYVPPEAQNLVSEHGSLQFPKTQDQALWYNLEEISILSMLDYGAVLSAVPPVRQFIIQNIIFGNRCLQDCAVLNQEPNLQHKFHCKTDSFFSKPF